MTLAPFFRKAMFISGGADRGGQGGPGPPQYLGISVVKHLLVVQVYLVLAPPNKKLAAPPLVEAT